jgi:SAM-dependent methyltransferase
MSILQEIGSLFLSRNPNKYWLNTLVILGVILCIVLWIKHQDVSQYSEGFSQNSKFVLKRNTEIYDDFYLEIYDRLMRPEQRVDFEIDKVIEMTQPSKKHAVFLDIGSGTGHLVNGLLDRGYNVYGVDNSEKMVNYSEKKHPDAPVKCGNVKEPMLFEKGTFTHILCTGMTIYHFENKIEFFKNCYHWLMPNGYLVLHLVEPRKFDTIVPGGKPPNFKSPQLYAPNRITDTIIDFVDFEYKAKYDFMDKSVDRTQKNNQVLFQETFTDNLTQNIRQNETVLYMDTPEEILTMASFCGYLVRGSANMDVPIGDKHQHLYVLERPQ